MFGHFIRPPQAGLDVLTASVAWSLSGTDPCTDPGSLVIQWTHSGSGTVKVQNASTSFGPWSDVATGLDASDGQYTHQLVDFSRNALGTNKTFHYRVVNEADAADYAQTSLATKVDQCF